MNRRVKVALSAAAIPIAVVVGLNTIYYRPFESPTQRAYRLCGECGWARNEIDWLIDANRYSTLTREQSLELFRDQFDDEMDAEYCAPCTTAILDAADAEVEQPGPRL